MSYSFRYFVIKSRKLYDTFFEIPEKSKILKNHVFSKFFEVSSLMVGPIRLKPVLRENSDKFVQTVLHRFLRFSLVRELLPFEISWSKRHIFEVHF